MKRTRTILILILLALLATLLVGAYRTRGIMAYLPFLEARKGSWTGEYVSRGIVDQRPWQTAATLSALAQSSEEKELAREAERLADHEVDQAFSQSLRQATLDKPKLTERALALQQRVTQLQQTLTADKARIAELQAAAGGALANAGDLELANAQLELDQNELTDAAEDLARESNDQSVRLQQELTARKATMKKYEEEASRNEGQAAVSAAEQYNTLSQQIAAWWAHRSRKALVAQAQELARADSAALSGDQTRLRAEADQMSSSINSSMPRQQRIDLLQRSGGMQKVLSLLSDRLDSQQQLVALYGRWAQQLEIQDKIVFHLMLRSLALIVAICLVALLAGWGLQLALERVLSNARQKRTMQTIVTIATQAVGLVLVLLVVFGVPQQMPTILGLATAGLTVVFQDFIIAVCGWFVLMGPNGIRVNDWVEIDGVGGEVVELNLFRTWLLETGNWTANGHPTGRRVSFLNGYAIRGKYFNFSTVGQWMWDEIKVSIPAGTKIHPLVEQVYDATVKATEADAKMAEAEWKRVTHETGAPQFSAMPSVNMRPAGASVDLVVRYITRAGVRLQKRNQLFETIVDLMQAKPEAKNALEA